VSTNPSATRVEAGEEAGVEEEDFIGHQNAPYFPLTCIGFFSKSFYLNYVIAFFEAKVYTNGVGGFWRSRVYYGDVCITEVRLLYLLGLHPSHAFSVEEFLGYVNTQFI
jgi:hypothetical protein